ncbi:sphingomyelin phosphodiesterase [Bermanella sp. WJH001]|uniref:sphingomyelin phosphodiesterase n=1 Tax=Bermanella sp. WJH001 TaxID=3048005 RepID=UPI0024BDF10D|nr:sphingomyelin phosphodiesterase [Bermanella sp. WJH001]MDJ1536849.1 sphingomyelin phosphodiesterase [Bermanella sp. WJH001]
MKFIRYLLICGFFISANALAESYMYLTNNTQKTLTLHTIQTGHNNITHGNQWALLAREVPPLGTVKFLRFNRDQGIKWGKEYEFNTYVSGLDEQVVLRQKLKGTMTFSKMWLSGQQDNWHYDRDVHKVSLNDTQTLAFKSEYARASGDDIRYVIHEDFPIQEKSQYSNELNVLTYNTWALLPGIEAKNTGNRLDTIASYMKNYDVIVFQEVFDPILTARFRKNIAHEYPYLTEIPWKLGKILTGGSFIASRWPIEAQDAVVYDACRADGCLAGKGINYAKIRKGSHAYHVFGTHTHAYTGADDIAVRFAQLAQFKALIDSKNIPYEEPVILGGDFNVDKLHFPQEHIDFLALFDATEPEAAGQYPHSYAGPVNVYAEDEYTEYLDYILYSNQHLAPYDSNNVLLTPRSIASEHWGSWDLSDHYPVKAEFSFPLQPEYTPF